MKKLVVFYSLSGNTRAVARRVARKLGAHLCEIKTEKTYPDDYDVLTSLAQTEVKTGYMPRLLPLKYDANVYDVVLVGTPVWWGSYAPAVKTFMNGVDWKGKRVFPFATCEGEVGRTPSDFRKALRGAAVAQPMIVQFEGGVQKTSGVEVTAWTEDIG